MEEERSNNMNKLELLLKCDLFDDEPDTMTDVVRIHTNRKDYGNKVPQLWVTFFSKKFL